MEKKTPFKELDSSQKAQFIWDYYKWHIIIALVVLIAILITVKDVTSRKNVIMSVFFVNDISQTSTPSEYFDDYLTENGYSTSKDSVYVDNSFSFNIEDASAVNTMYALNTLMVTGTYGAFFSDEATYDHYAKQEYFQNLTSLISDDLLEQYKDDLYYYEDPESGELLPCGIKLTQENCTWLKESKAFESCYFGLLFGDTDKEILKSFAEYVLR